MITLNLTEEQKNIIGQAVNNLWSDAVRKLRSDDLGEIERKNLRNDKEIAFSILEKLKFV